MESAFVLLAINRWVPDRSQFHRATLATVETEDKLFLLFLRVREHQPVFVRTEANLLPRGTTSIMSAYTSTVVLNPETACDKYMYISAYIYIYVPAHTRTYIYIYIYIHTYTDIYTHTCMHACMHACMHVCMYVYIYMCVYTYR